MIHLKDRMKGFFLSFAGSVAFQIPLKTFMQDCRMTTFELENYEITKSSFLMVEDGRHVQRVNSSKQLLAA